MLPIAVKPAIVSAAAGPATKLAARTQAIPINFVVLDIAISLVSTRTRRSLHSLLKNGRFGGVEATPPIALLTHFTGPPEPLWGLGMADIYASKQFPCGRNLRATRITESQCG